MQNMHWKLIIILAALGICVWSLVRYDLAFGKDLAGGLSMTYEVTLEEGDNPDDIMPQVIAVIKNRLNPQGTLDISVVRQGRNRIEIVMPLPDEKVKAAKDRVNDLIDEVLAAARISEPALFEALAAGTAVSKWGGPDSDFGDQIAALQAAYERKEAAVTAYQALRDATDRTDDALDAAEAELAAAEVEFDQLVQNTLAQSMGEDELRRMIELSNEPQAREDPSTGHKVRDETGKFIMDPSARSVELNRLKNEYPGVAQKLDSLVGAWDHYRSISRGYDDAEDLKRLMRGAGVLEFRIAVAPGTTDARFNIEQLRQDLAERGPDAPSSSVAQWFEINDLKQWYKTQDELASIRVDPARFFAGRGLVATEHEGKYYVLLYDTDEAQMTRQSGSWQLKSATRTSDNIGRPAVAFALDAAGGQLMGRLTGNHIDEPMAIVLDGEVYSAPNIRSRIGSSGEITGTFSEQEISYLIRVLASGSLEARLSEQPISEVSLGPSIGRDNLNAGLEACLVGIIAVAAFMLLYYFVAGGIADIALLCNGIIIFGIMAMQHASLTLPGIAGIVLTIGMAVDANVLIYERIREEMFAGEEDLKTCIRLGYGKALSTIIDANVTNLIVCAILYYTATAEVKGFAVTLTIGILATLFTALFVTRVIFTLYTDVFKVKSLPMLATVVPAVHRALEPNINWIGLRRIFQPLSLIAVVGSLILVSSYGVEMYDTEFRGGVSATMLTAPTDPDDANSPRIMLERSAVEERARSIAEGEPPTSPLSNFATATVYSAGSNQDGTQSDSFLIKVALDTEDPTVMNGMIAAIVAEFRDVLDVAPPTTFSGAGQDEPPPGATFPITKRFLGDVIGRPGFTRNVEAFRGGVAVVVEDLNPPVRLRDVESRMSKMRQQPDFRVAVTRTPTVIGLDQVPGTETYSSLVILVNDERYPYDANVEVWDAQVAQVEWSLISQALQEEASLEQVSTYSSSVADTLAANAIVAVGLSLLGILVYIWIRFGSFRYSFAAVLALIHDVSIGLGALALSHFIADMWPGNPLGIEAFKIDLGVVAALLTIVGYSINDTIVIMDRIRENRGKVPIASARIVNLSINQTISRTVLTSFTTILAVVIMYAAGGTGIRPFAYTLLIGLICGTYSTIAIAAPMVFRRIDGDGTLPAPAGGPGEGAPDESDLAVAV